MLYRHLNEVNDEHVCEPLDYFRSAPYEIRDIDDPCSELDRDNDPQSELSRDNNPAITSNVNNLAITSEPPNPNYIQWQMFDDIPERVYTIECEGYIDKNGRYIDDESSLKHLTNGEPSKVYSEDGYLIGHDDDAYYCVSYSKYDLRKMT